MKYILILLVLFAASFNLCAQDETIPTAPKIEFSKPGDPVRFADIFPEYPGGEKKMYKDIYLSLVYPEAEKAAGVTGKVFVDFVIEKNGEVSEVRVLRGVDGHPDLSRAAIEAVEKLNSFKPAYIDNSEVRFRMTIVVEFSKKRK